MEKVSVIMPVYNCEKFLKYAIHSVQRQTNENWELIVIDDASSDASLDEVLKFAKQDKRIQVCSMTYNQGVGACRNIGIKHATGKYLAFLDADDLWSKHKLQKQVSFMQEHDYGLSHTGFAYINEKGQLMPTGIVRVDENVNLLKYMKTTQVGMSTVMIDRTKFPDVAFPEDRKLCEDATTWISLLRKGAYFHGVDDVLMLYRVRENQLSGNKLKMAKNTLYRYLNEKSIPFYQRPYCFLNYAYNGFAKRLSKNDLNQSVILDSFNCRER